MNFGRLVPACAPFCKYAEPIRFIGNFAVMSGGYRAAGGGIRSGGISQLSARDFPKLQWRLLGHFRQVIEKPLKQYFGTPLALYPAAPRYNPVSKKD